MANSAIFGVKSTFGLSTPSGCVTRRSKRRREVELDEVDGEVSGATQIVRLCPVSFGTETVEISGRGNPGIVTVAAGVIIPGTHTLTSRKVTEFNTKEPEFELRSQTMFATAA